MFSEELFIKYYLEDDTDNMFELLKDIDYNSLDYSIELNQLMLYKYIIINLNYGYYDIDIEKVREFSDIQYYILLSNTSIKSIKYYREIMISYLPRTNLDTIFYIYYNKHKSIEGVTDIEIINNINQEILYEVQNELNKLENTYYPIYNHIVETITNNKLNNYSENPEKFIHNKRKILNYLSHYKNSRNKDGLKKCIDILKTSKYIRNELIEKHELYLQILQNKPINANYILEVIGKLYSINTNILEIKIWSKYSIIQDIAYILLLLMKNSIVECKVLENYININLDSSEFDEYSINYLNIIYQNFYGYLTDINVTPEWTKREIYLHKILDVLKFSFELDKRYMAAFDLCMVYNNLKMYQELSDFYLKNKQFIDHFFKNNNMKIRLYPTIINAMIETHQIESIDELNEIMKIENLENSGLDTDIARYNRFKTAVEQLTKYKEILVGLGVNIVEKYDINKDENGLRDGDNKLVCPICYENIEREKITLVQCVSCKKYVGHIRCIVDYIKNQLKQGRISVDCLNCRHKYMLRYNPVAYNPVAGSKNI